MTDRQNSDDLAGELHTGYDLESGFLARVREWTDLLPWLRLVRTLRVAGSPVMVGLVAITYLVWWSGQNVLTTPPEQPPATIKSTVVVVELVTSQVANMVPISFFAPGEQKLDFWEATLSIAWTLLAWLPVTLYLLRQGAMLTAGRELVGLAPGLWRGVRLTPVAVLIAVVPLVCVLLFAAMVWVIGWLATWIEGITWLEWMLVALMILPALACGVLGFGAYVAVPLGWAALTNERDPDALDALSRGYEYLYRRPLHLALYALLMFLMLAVITSLASLIAQVAMWVSASMLITEGNSSDFFIRFADLLAYYPSIVCLTLFWALVGGVYLLLRYDAGEQEVEDLWQPAPKPKPPLPELNVAVGTDR